MEQIFYDDVSSKDIPFRIFFLEDSRIILTGFSLSVPESMRPNAIIRKDFRWRSLFLRYFSGEKTDLSSLPIHIEYFSPSAFQRCVWEACRHVGYSETISYSALSEKFSLGNPRAVGNAISKNPLPLIIPCHRVVAKKGIGGFMGSTAEKDLSVKRRLLELESSDGASETR
ncbi:MAG: methylated-DNA--[protein]-cysteine S-methyltransferase [Candidatus Woesearchaeota archaeon]